MTSGIIATVVTTVYKNSKPYNYLATYGHFLATFSMTDDSVIYYIIYNYIYIIALIFVI